MVYSRMVRSPDFSGFVVGSEEKQVESVGVGCCGLYKVSVATDATRVAVLTYR